MRVCGLVYDFFFLRGGAFLPAVFNVSIETTTSHTHIHTHRQWGLVSSAAVDLCDCGREPGAPGGKPTDPVGDRANSTHKRPELESTL